VVHQKSTKHFCVAGSTSLEACGCRGDTLEANEAYQILNKIHEKRSGKEDGLRRKLEGVLLRGDQLTRNVTAN